MLLWSRASVVCAAFVTVMLAGCGSSETTFTWDVPERPTRADTFFFGGDETLRQQLFDDAKGTFNFPDGRSNMFEARIMWLDFDTTRDGNDDPLDDPVDDMEFLVLTDRAGLVPELTKLAEAAEVRVDTEAVQRWVDTHDRESEPSINIPITGWRPDRYVMYFTVVDSSHDEHQVSLSMLWPGSLTYKVEDLPTDPAFDPSSPYLLP